MNILLANLTKMVEDSGGLAKVTCLLAQELHKRGNRVTIVSPLSIVMRKKENFSTL